jgi:hypothetical protein
MARARAIRARRTTPRRPSRIGRLLRVLLVAALLVGGAAAAALLAAVERAPRVESAPAPDGEAAIRALELYRSAREMVYGDGGELEITETELNDGFAAASRMWRGVAGRVLVDEDGVWATASLPIPRTALWLNAQGGVRAGEDGLALAGVRIGRLDLPDWAVGPLSRIALDLLLGERAGTALFAAIEEVETSPPVARVALAPVDQGDVAIGDGIRRLLSAQAGATDAEAINARIAAIDGAVADGDLPKSGSFAPYLDMVLAEAGAADDPQAEFRTMLYALALYCGDVRFAQAIGVERPDRDAWRASCKKATLSGRRDSRMHFVITAALAAALSPDGARGIGELKELHDSRLTSGFDFTDIAANHAGAAYAITALRRMEEGAPPPRIRSEGAVMPEIEDLPRRLDDEAFRDQFGDVASPEYEAMLAEIERRIESLPFHQPAAGG